MPQMGPWRASVRRRPAALAAAVLTVTAAGLAIPVTSSAATSTWTESSTSGPAANQFSAMAYDQATGTDVLFTESGQTWTWDGTTWAQQNPSASPPGRMDPGLAYDPVHQQVVLFGGESQSGSTFYNDTWTWNGTTWTQQQPSVSPTARLAPGMAWDAAQNRIILFGGYEAIGIFYADTWAWNGSAWTELIANALTEGAGPQPRAGAMMSDDQANVDASTGKPSGTIVMFGGSAPSGVLGDTWVWNDAAGSVGRWTQVSSVNSPVARGGGKMAYSPTANAPVLFGGISANSTLLSDTWTFDGGGWSQATPTGQPPARQNATMATAPGGGVVMNGGQGTSGILSDTWTWSGSIDTAPLPAATVVSCPPAGPMTVALPTDATGTGTLRGAAAAAHPGLYIGSALPSSQQMQVDVGDQMIAGSQENLIDSSNQMYWSADEPQEGVFNFCDGDQFAGMAAANHQTLRLHNLVAGQIPSQAPNWVNSPTIPWTKASLEAAMKQYITTTMTHYKGKVKVYDVANEAINNDGSVAANVFTNVIGYPRWVEDAFDDAYAADPTATLIYDDYNDWYDAPNATPPTNKETAVYNLVTDLIPHHITTVGFELFATGSWMLPGSGASQSAPLAAAMAKFGALNNGTMQTAITQMTVPFFNANPSAFDISQEAKVYGYAMNACLQPASHCIMLNTWGISDEGGPAVGEVIAAFAGQPGSPAWGGSMFDEAYQPRPAFTAVLAELQQTAPTTLTATAGAGQVALSWTAATSSAGPITGYEVYRGTSTGAEQPYTTLGASATSFTDTAVTSGTTYYYTVSGINGTGDGPQSGEASATPS